MPISINWKTKVIYVPKDFMTLIQPTPVEIRELNLNTFRLALKDLEDDEEGMPFLDTHRHNTEVTVAGLTLARVVEIINGYTVTFEDGQYAVNLPGANSNVGDVVNVNQVSVRTFNSAGLISSPAIEYSSYQDRVTIDVNSPYSGTLFPVGTSQQPVNNLADALIIAETKGFKALLLLSSLTLHAGVVVDDYLIKSPNWSILTVESGASTTNTEYEKLSLYGVMDGFWNVITDCWVFNITNFCGWLRGGSFEYIELAPYTVENAGQSYFDAIVPMYPHTPSVLVMNTNVAVSYTTSSDLHEIRNMTEGSVLSIGLAHGELILDSSCIGGTVIVSGIGDVINNSLLVPETINLVNAEGVADEVRVELTAELSEISKVKKFMANRLRVNKNTGAWTVYADDGTTPLYTGSIADDGTFKDRVPA